MENLTRVESVCIQSETLYMEEEIDRSLLCTICQEVLKIPKECNNCHNNFCKKCIDMWLETKNGICPFRCPGKIVLNKSHKIIIDSLRKLKFICKNVNEGCESILNYNNYTEHAHSCGLNKIKCTSSNCAEIIFQKNFDEHLEKECIGYIHQCKICKFEWIGNKIIPHECAKHAFELFSETKQTIDNFLINMHSKMFNIDNKIKEINNKLL